MRKVVSLSEYRRKIFSREKFVLEHFPDRVRQKIALDKIDNEIDDCKAAIMHAWALKNIGSMKMFTERLYILKETKEGLLELFNKK